MRHKRSIHPAERLVMHRIYAPGLARYAMSEEIERQEV